MTEEIGTSSNSGNRIITAIADELTKNNKHLFIDQSSILRSVNVVDVVNNNNLSGLDVKIASVLGNEISNIKDNIIPIIKSYGKEVTKILSDKINVSPFSNVNIITAEVPTVVTELVSRNIININGSKNTQLGNSVLSIPTPDMATMRSYLKAGGGQMEVMVKEFANLVSDADLLRIWETYLVRISADNTNYVGLGTKVNSGIYSMDLIVLSIIVKTLINEVPGGIRATPGTYETVMNVLDSILDAKVAMFIKTFDAYDNLGKLILKADDISDIIVVKSNYDKFLADGGSPEAIYGAVLNGIKTAGINTIKDKSDDFVTAWNKYVSNETIKQKLSTLEQHRVAYRFGMTEILNNYMSDDVKDSIPDGIVDNINAILIDYMNSVNHMELFEVNTIVEEIVTTILFGHTNAEAFIKYMKHYSSMDSKITANEAATYASMDLIVDFLLTQISIK